MKKDRKGHYPSISRHEQIMLKDLLRRFERTDNAVRRAEAEMMASAAPPAVSLLKRLASARAQRQLCLSQMVIIQASLEERRQDGDS